MSAETEQNHRCFGCGKAIGDMEEHIHVGMDEWATTQGMEALGLDDMLTFAFCHACTQDGGQWTPERHAISKEASERG
jgi:hypothetical protein